MIAKKVQAVLDAGMHPILCVGEKERDAQALYLEALMAQIKGSLAKIPRRFADQLIVAYEPVWAIGAKEPMDPATIQEMSLFVKKTISDMYGHDNGIATPILYGGAVNFRNAGDIIARGGVDGLLVGRESVNAPSFTELLKAVDSM
jgi:triosephosphate isomerase